MTSLSKSVINREAPWHFEPQKFFPCERLVLRNNLRELVAVADTPKAEPPE
jgi:hypothetical protein